MFDRYWRLKISDVEGKFTYDIKPDDFGRSLKISFDINVSTDIRFYTATIKVWNLSPDKRTNLNYNLLLDEFGKGPKIELIAGYREKSAIIFDGAIIRGYPVKDTMTGNWITVMQCGIPLKTDKKASVQQVDVNNGSLYGFISSAIKKIFTQEGRAAVKYAPNYERNLRSAVAEYTDHNTIDKALGYEGTVAFILAEISREFNLIFFFGNNGFNVKSGKFGSNKDMLTIPDGTTMPEITFDSALKQIIGAPIYTDTGARITTYLTPELRLFQLIEVKSRILNRKVSIISLSHKGDSRSNEWYSEIDGVNTNSMLRSA